MGKKTSASFAIVLCTAVSLWAQQPQQGGPPGGTSSPSPGGRPTQPQPGQPGQPGQQGRQDPFGTRQSQQQMPQRRQPVFLSGNVVLEDGTAPAEPVVIERICNGRNVPEGYTDSKGRFSFELGNNSTMAMMDASVSGSNSPGIPGGFGNDDPFGSPGGGLGGGALGQVNLIGCELRAVLGGYTSESIQLGRRSVFDNPSVGTIILRRLGNVQGTSISVTTLAAPKKAKKSYDKAFKEVRKSKPNFKKAEKELEKALVEYPEFAAAWFLLGRVRLSGQNVPGAREAFEKAVEADGKYMNPYSPLVRIALQENRWEDAEELSARVLQLNPHVTEAQYFRAVASYNMGDLEQAEKSAKAVQEANDGKNFPGTYHLMGMLLAKKGKFGPAADEFRTFLTQQPGAPAAETIERQLNEWEALGVIKSAGIPVTDVTQSQPLQESEPQ